MDVLRSKHPEALPPTVQILEAYGVKPPVMVPVDITDVTVETVYGGVRGDRRGGLRHPVTLDAAVLSGKSGTTVDYWGVMILYGQWSPTLGCL